MTVEVALTCQETCKNPLCQNDEKCYGNLVCLKSPVSPGVSPSPPSPAPISAPAQDPKRNQMWMIVGGSVGLALLLIIIMIWFSF